MPVVAATRGQLLDTSDVRSHNGGKEGVWFGYLIVASLLFLDDEVLLASSSHDLQRALEQFETKCEVAWIRVGPSKTEVMVLNRKRCGVLLPSG